MKQLVTSAALLVAIAVAAPSAFAITAAQKAEIKKAITSVPVPEMPAKAADLVAKASKTERSDVAVQAVKTAIYRSRASAPQVVAAVSKAAPDLAGVVSMTAVQLEGDQANLIAQAATTAAPASKGEIASSVRSGLVLSSGLSASGPVQYTSGFVAFNSDSAAGSLMTRGSYGGVPTGGVVQTNRPINQTGGGGGGGTFPGTPPTSAGPGQTIDYTNPRGF